MSQPLLSRFPTRGHDTAPIRLPRAAPWPARPEAEGPAVAVMLTACRDVAAAVRGYRTVLPRAQVWLYDPDLSPDERGAAEAAGADVRLARPSSRDDLVRRMFAEVDADIYILAHGAGADDVCVAPLIVAEIGAGRDLVDVRRFSGAPGGHAAERVLGRAVDFAFGGGGDALTSDFKACSRRFALSYGRTRRRDGSDHTSARDLALHALRLRLPVGQIAALGTGQAAPGARAPLGRACWAETLGIVARLLVEERPRRVLGLLGLGLIGLGLAAAAPELRIHHWQAVLVPGPEIVASVVLLVAGGAVGAAGIALDALASARQEVGRLGVAAIPRRADRGAPTT